MSLQLAGCSSPPVRQGRKPGYDPPRGASLTVGLLHPCILFAASMRRQCQDRRGGHLILPRTWLGRFRSIRLPFALVVGFALEPGA